MARKIGVKLDLAMTNEMTSVETMPPSPLPPAMTPAAVATCDDGNRSTISAVSETSQAICAKAMQEAIRIAEFVL